ncbi:MAG: phosphoribosylformylglycinamidine synthase subunit PurS [Saprospiraceae bacterium]|nr:phosphoribosylformylglycinamidine synthase subunit PurS [Saprospiraceae bacterium]
MKFIAEIDIMPKKELLDPQGKTVGLNLKNIDIHNMFDVRIGKHIQLVVESENEQEASNMVDSACQKLFTNPIMESYHFVLHSYADTAS